MRAVVLFFLSVLAAACSSNGVGAAADPGVRAALDAIIDDVVGAGFAGQLVVMRDGAIIYDRAAGYADAEGTIPVTDETLYQVSSLVKFFTAVMALKAVEDGKLSLGDTAATLFPDSALAARDFTLDELLKHRSGLRSTYAAESISDPARAIDAIAAANAAHPKDGAFHYSNDGFDALAVALERIYAAPYETLFRNMLARPAGIAGFAFWGEANVDDPHLRGQPLTPTPPEIKGRNYGMLGSAGLLISAGDLAAFRAALDDGKVLGPAMLAVLDEPRGKIRIGDVLYGAFLVDTPLGPARSARGAEDWGDNAYLNAYPDCGVVIAVVTSRGPADVPGKELFRNQIIEPVEQALARDCERQK
ncbi:MAG: beta-lactamase family protein [Parvularculaceae bacterium]|nr:beta-lactamase family protein [Parvularculaceae bacterium]